jgi:hypothetical protein
MVLGVIVVCMPMMFVCWLLLAAKWTKMDALTMHMPEGARSIVVKAMLAESSDAPTLQRAGKLDADAVKEWQRRPHFRPGVQPATPPEVQAMYRQQIENRKYAQTLSKKAQEDEQAGHACDAEELYTQAAGKYQSPEFYQYTEGVGRAGLKCGDMPGARAGLEAAILIQTNFLKGTEEDQLTSVRQDRLRDREFLIVVYEKQHESALARKVCSDAHPGWKACTCKLASGDVVCAAQ